MGGLSHCIIFCRKSHALYLLVIFSEQKEDNTEKKQAFKYGGGMVHWGRVIT